MEPQGQPLYRLDIPVRWGDMDALGHVNNAIYFRYFEQVRLEWYEQLGFSVLGEKGVKDGFVVVDNQAEYLKPLVYPATAILRMGGHSPGKSSFVTTYTLCVGNELFTRGSATCVWIDTHTGKSAPLPDRVRALLDPPLAC